MRTQDRVCNRLHKKNGVTLLYPIQFIRDLCSFSGFNKLYNDTIEKLSLTVRIFNCNGNTIPVEAIEYVCISAEDHAFKVCVNQEWHDVCYRLNGNLFHFQERDIRYITIEHSEGLQQNLDNLAMHSVDKTPLHIINQILGATTHFPNKTAYDLHRKKVMNDIRNGRIQFPAACDEIFFQKLLQQVLELNGNEMTLLPQKYNHK